MKPKPTKNEEREMLVRNPVRERMMVGITMITMKGRERMARKWRSADT